MERVENHSSQFKHKLQKLRRDDSLIIKNSKDLEKKAEKGEIAFIKGDLRFPLIIYSFFLLIIVVMVLIWIYGFNFFDFTTFVIIISVWLGTGIIFSIATKSSLIILHPDGFLIRRYIFFKFSQKWKILNQEPSAALEYDSEGGKHYNVIFSGTWGEKRMSISFLRIKDIKKSKKKMDFILDIILKYYNKSLM